MRSENWPEILAAELKKAAKKTFAWGSHDCCLFAADVAYAMTGEDYASEFRGHYSTSIGAAMALKKYGAGSIKATLTTKLGEPLPPMQAGRGDFVLADAGQGDTVGICCGPQAAFVSINGGLLYLPMAAWICAWRIV